MFTKVKAESPLTVVVADLTDGPACSAVDGAPAGGRGAVKVVAGLGHREEHRCGDRPEKQCRINVTDVTCVRSKTPGTYRYVKKVEG